VIPLLAQISATPDWTAMVIQGGVGAIAVMMLRWFMLRSEVRMKALEVSNDRMSRTNLLLVIGLRNANEAVKIEAQAMLKELNESQQNRSGDEGK
jgi:hypothetical protein